MEYFIEMWLTGAKFIVGFIATGIVMTLLAVITAFCMILIMDIIFSENGELDVLKFLLPNKTYNKIMKWLKRKGD